MLHSLYNTLSGEPVKIRLQTINRCNSHCITCPYTKTHALNKEVIMSEDIWKKLLHELIEQDFSGWISFCVQMEPLLDPFLYNRIRDIKNHTNAQILIMTNVSMLNIDNIQDFIDLKIDVVYLSLLSLNENNYENWTGLNYKKTVDLINNLRQRKVGTKFKVLIAGPDYYDNTKNITTVFEGIERENYWIVSPDSRAGCMPNQQAILNCGCIASTEYDFCVQPWNAITILADGTYILCDLDWKSQVRIGAVKTDTISSIYEKMSVYRNQFAVHNYSEEMCKACSKEYNF